MDYINSIETHMDFEGQGRAETYFRFIVTLFAVVGIVWGYTVQQFSQTVFILAAGFALAFLITIPPWPMYRRKPLHWLKSSSSDAQSDTAKKPKKK